MNATIANARLAYLEFNKRFATERFQKHKEKGVRLQRPLWASTSTKNPAYPDVLNVEDLIGPDAVNTMPPQTLAAFSIIAEYAKAWRKIWKVPAG